MIRLSDGDIELGVAVVAAGAAAAKLAVVFGPVGPIVPQSGMNQQESFPRLGKAEDLLANGRGGEGSVVAQEEHIEIAEGLRHVIGFSGRAYFHPWQGREGL